MAIKTKNRKPHTANRGFALLVALVFMSVMLSFGLALGSLGYKQSVLASDANRSQDAFYVADAALECVLYADQQQNIFSYTSDMAAPAPLLTCDGVSPRTAEVTTHTLTNWVITSRLKLDNSKHCADVTVSKPAPGIGGTTYLSAQGYDVSCETVENPGYARFASRGLSARY